MEADYIPTEVLFSEKILKQLDVETFRSLLLVSKEWKEAIEKEEESVLRREFALGNNWAKIVIEKENTVCSLPRLARMFKLYGMVLDKDLTEDQKQGLYQELMDLDVFLFPHCIDVERLQTTVKMFLNLQDSLVQIMHFEKARVGKNSVESVYFLELHNVRNIYKTLWVAFSNRVPRFVQSNALRAVVREKGTFIVRRMRRSCRKDHNASATRKMMEKARYQVEKAQREIGVTVEIGELGVVLGWAG